jgi:hypothetical protein
VRGVALAVVAGGALAMAGTAVAGPPPAVPDPGSGSAVLALAAERGTVPPAAAGTAPAAPVAAGAAPFTVPVPGGAGGAAVLVPPVLVPPVLVPPVLVPPVLDAPAPDPAVLDPAALSRAVGRAQGEARRLAEEARDRTAEQRASAAARADADTRAAAQAQERRAAAEAEERRTAERARRAGRAGQPDPTPAPAPATERDCGLATGGLGAVRPHVRAAAELLGCAFGKPQVLGIAGRGGPSDHPKGLALDFMVDRAAGDALAAYAIRNRDALGISYVIWRQRIDTGSGFRAMADRGGPTANHFDHVHVSFRPTAGTGLPGGR